MSEFDNIITTFITFYLTKIAQDIGDFFCKKNRNQITSKVGSKQKPFWREKR